MKFGAILAAKAADRSRDRLRYRSAALFYALALVFNPRRRELDVQLANMLKDAGWQSLATRAYARAIRRQPDLPDTYLQAARLHRLSGRPEDAVAAYLGALERNPDLWVAATEIAAIEEGGPATNVYTRIVRLTQAADRSSACGDFAEAAELYRQAHELAPHWNHLAIQRANMLKDSGKVEAAREVYAAVAAAEPDDPEPWIRLGHLGNLIGDKDAARDAFETALRLDPGRDDVRHELVMAGDVRHQEEAFLRRHASAEWAEVAGLAARIEALEGEAKRLRSRMREPHVKASYPVGLYGHYLAAHRVGPPPSKPQREVLVLVSGREAGVERIHRVVRGYLDQRSDAWRVVVLGGGSDVEKAVGRIALAEPRLVFRAGEDDLASCVATAAEEALILLPAPGAVADPHALAWLAFALEGTPAWGSVSDAVEEDSATGAVVPVLRDAPDPVAASWGAADCGGVLFQAASLRPVTSGATTLNELRAAVCNHLVRDPRLAHVPLPLFRVPSAGVEEAAHAGPLQPPPADSRTIGVVILTRDNGEDARGFVGSLRATASRPELLQIVVVDNGSRDPATLQALEHLAREGEARILPLDVPFNWSWLNNEAARSLATDLIVFANDDMTMLTESWDETLRALLAKPEIGAVGAYLVYPDNTLQHAGVLMGWNGSVIHEGLGEHADAPGFLRRHRRVRAVSAITGAFMAMRRDIFEALSGFDDKHLPIAYSDIHMCLSIRARGLAVVVTPFIRLRHFESKSRGPDRAGHERRARNAEEQAVMVARWGDVLRTDWGLNPHWIMATLPLRLLRWPSKDRIVSHIERTGHGETWLLPKRGAEPDLCAPIAWERAEQ